MPLSSSVTCLILDLVLGALLFAGDFRSALAGSDGPRVSIDQGLLQGVYIGNTSCFLNIPFAKPPVGDLRWRKPQPANGWSGIRDASVFGPQCVQPSAGGLQSEDCLQLNVFKPTAATPSSRLPVMVWIHGGAFQSGSAVSFAIQNLTNYLEGKVVAVSVNCEYRVQ